MFRTRLAVLASAAALFIAAPASAQVILQPPYTQPGPPDLVPHISGNKSTILAGPYSGGGVTETVLFTIRVDNQTTVVASNRFTGAKQIAGSDASGVSLEVYLGPSLRQGGGIIASNGLTCWSAQNGHAVQCSNGTIAAGSSAEVVIEAFADRIAAPCVEWDRATVKVDPANTIGETNESNNEEFASITITSMC